MSETSRATEKRADKAFARYVTEGSVDALAEVFDLCAPKLALLAAHLAPLDRSTIDDLIQTTFTEAIRSAPHFEAGRPVMPWLATILARRAKDRHRRLSTRPELSVDDVAEPVDPQQIDPAEFASDRELREQVLAAIDQLGAPYAEVLRLRWSHDLTPQEIARALDRPLGTVLSQCKRGVERLRQRLPERLGLALAPLGVPDLGWETIRDQVLRLGHELARPTPVGPPSVPPAPPVLVALMSTKILSLAVVSAALLWLAWFVMDGASAPNPGSLQRERLAVESAANSDDSSVGAERIGSTDGAMSSVGMSDPEVDGGLVRMTGTVLAAESGLPLRGVEVIAREERGLWGSSPEPMEFVEHRTETDAEGRFAIAFRSPEVGGSRLLLKASDRVTMSAYFREPFREGLDLELDPVEMTIGPRLRVTMLDDGGQPIPYATLQLGGSPGLESSMFWGAGWSGTLRADASGVIESSGPMAPGTWKVEFVSEHGLKEPEFEEIEIPARAGLVEAELRYGSVTRPEWTLRGQVIDERGAPVLGVDVVGFRKGDAGRRSSQVFGQGRFVLPGMLPDRGPIVLGVSPSDSDDLDRYEVLQPSGELDFGGAPILIVVRKIEPGGLRVRLVDPTGAAVERFGRLGHRYVERKDLALSVGRVGASSTRLHPQGLVELSPVPHGKYRFLMFPEREDLEPIVTGEISLEPGVSTGEPVHVQARLAAMRTITVREESGEPIPGAELSWIVSPIASIERTSSHEDIHEVLRGRGGFSSIPSYVVSTARSGEDGLAELRTGPDLGGSRLRVVHPGFREQVIDLQGDQVIGQIEVVLEPAASFTGELVPLELVQQLGPDPDEIERADRMAEPERALRWSLSRLRLSPLGEGEEFEAVVDRMGRFRFESVPAGSYALEFEPERGEPARLREVTFAEGEQVELQIDLEPLRPIPVRGLLRINGQKPPSGTQLRLGPTVEIAEDGSFECGLRAGRHEVQISVPVGGDRSVGIELDPFVVQSGVPAPPLFLEASYRSVQFRVENEDGSPRREAWLLWRPSVDGETQERWRIRLVGTDGQVRIDAQWQQPIEFSLGLTPPAERGGEWTDVLPIGVFERPKDPEPIQRTARVPADR